VNPETAGLAQSITVKALGQEPNKGTMLALSILLLWLAGVLFFVAFEGSKILGQNVAATGEGGVSYVKSILSWVGAKATEWGAGAIGQGPLGK
jgi:hypothetical protein